MRDDPGAARLGSPERAHDQARADPPPGQQARPADRHAVHQPRRARRHRRRPRARAIPRGSTRSATVASTSSAGIPAAPRPAPGCAASRASAASRSFWAGASIPTKQAAAQRTVRRKTARPGAALRRGQRLASAPHLDCRHRARPRPPARPDGRGEAHLRGLLLRHLPRPDLREHVPRPGPGDAARRRRRSRSDTRGAPSRGSPAMFSGFGRRGLRSVPLPLRQRRDRSAARSREAATPRPSGSSGCVARVKRAADPRLRGRTAAVVAPEVELRRSVVLAVPAVAGPEARGRQTRRISRPRSGATDRRSRTGRAAPHLARRLGRRHDLGGDLLRRRARPAGS